MMSRVGVSAVTFGVLCWVSIASVATAAPAIKIGTGASPGIYWPVGEEICELYEQATEDECLALNTGGSLYNANSVRNGDLDFGIVQSDVQFSALQGLDAFYDNGPSPELRSIMSLHAEPFTVVATSPEVHQFDDLIGKRVNVGNPGSGHRATLEALLDAQGQTQSIFKLASELEPGDMTRILCAGRLDAFFYVVGHPSQTIGEAARRCNAHLVSVEGPGVDTLLAQTPYYTQVTIPGGLYANTPEDIRTFGVRATLMTRADVDDEVVFRLVGSIFDNLDRFRQAHPALSRLTPQQMIRDGLTAPLHDGARRYYEQAGLLPADSSSATP